MVKDMMGHDLKEGDWITIKHLLPDFIAGKIVSISEGGLLAAVQNPNQAQTIPGNLRVAMEINVNFNPTMPVAVLKLLPPPEQGTSVN